MPQHGYRLMIQWIRAPKAGGPRPATLAIAGLVVLAVALWLPWPTVFNGLGGHHDPAPAPSWSREAELIAPTPTPTPKPTPTAQAIQVNGEPGAVCIVPESKLHKRPALVVKVP